MSTTRFDEVPPTPPPQGPGGTQSAPPGRSQRAKSVLLAAAVALAGVLLVGLLLLVPSSGKGGSAAMFLSGPVCGAWEDFSPRGLPGVGGWTQISGLEVISPTSVWAAGVSGASSGRQSAALWHWDGEETRSITLPRFEAESTSLTAISAVSSAEMWAVGRYGIFGDGALALRWDGSAWDLTPSPDTGQLSERLWAVSGTGSKDAWAVGTYGERRVLIERWDGSYWRIYPAEDKGELRSVASIGADDVWAVGLTEEEKTLAMRWDGAYWTVHDTPSPCAGGNVLQSVSASGPRDVWVVGSCSNFGRLETSWAQYTPITLHWDGQSWIEESPPPVLFSARLAGVVAVAPGDVWAVGYDEALSTTDGEPALTPDNGLVFHWDGTSWSEIPSPAADVRASLHAVAALSPREIWVAGEREGKPLLMRLSVSDCEGG